MSNNKELPKEVVDKIEKLPMFESERRLWISGARIAQSHYEPIIEELKKGYEPLNNQLRDALKDVGDLQEYLQRTKQGKLGSSVLKEATKLLTEKDAKIKKLMGLLKEKTTIDSLDTIQNRIWEKFKEKHGL